MKDLQKTLILLSYRDANNNAINNISHILQQSTAQPRLPILTFSSMLPQIQTPYPSPVIITHAAESAPRVEPVVQPPRVKQPMTVPTSPPRV